MEDIFVMNPITEAPAPTPGSKAPNMNDCMGKISIATALYFKATDLGGYGLPNVIPDAGKHIDDIVNGALAFVESDTYSINHKLNVIAIYDYHGQTQYMFQFLKDPSNATLMTGLYYVDGDDLVKV